jgi:hypothetical protein
MLAFFEPSKPYVRDSVESISLPLADAAEQRRRDDLDRAVTRQVESLRRRLETLGDAEKPVREAVQGQIQLLEQTRPSRGPLALGLTDAAPTAEPTRIRVRGDAHKPGDEVQPGFLAALDVPAPEIQTPNGRTTGRRTALARWIADDANPLTARVVANRLWHHHFGRGIVSTPSDFGAMGEVPSHPELLDWLAAELVDVGWSLKAIHRLIVTSAAYRRSGTWDDEAAEIDPENRLLWRRPPRRLEAEPIRDAMLAVSDSLNPAMGGESVRPPIDRAVLEGQSRPGSGWDVSPPSEANRRSVYVRVKRTLLLPELEILDAPDTNDPCPARPVTTTSLQALTFLNGQFAHEQAAALATRLEAGAPERSGRIDLAYRLALSRPPTVDEADRATSFLGEHARRIAARPDPAARTDPEREALRAFCLALLNCNEFVTID